jgi:hypothetical protein
MPVVDEPVKLASLFAVNVPLPMFIITGSMSIVPVVGVSVSGLLFDE